MTDVFVPAATAVLALTLLALAAWRLRRKPVGQWLAMVGVAALGLTLHTADWAADGSTWAALRAAGWLVALAATLVGLRAARRLDRAIRALAGATADDATDRRGTP